MEGAARRLQVSRGRIAVVGTTGFVRACAPPPPASGLCRGRGAAYPAAARRGFIAVRAGLAACIRTAGRGHGRAACARTAEDLLHAVNLAAVVLVAVADIAGINTWQLTNTL